MKKNVTPWLWVPTLYFAEGIPYFIVNVVSVTMFKRMGFHFLVNNKTFGKLYEMKCDPFPENALFCRREELRKRYEEHFS